MVKHHIDEFQANARGGKVLSLLHEQTMNNVSGEAKSKELCLYLMQAASMPYMQILEKWVYKGVICDPYQEVSDTPINFYIMYH
jgi:gamma-tubulin complex component 2